jgi:alkylation response protein AidB-like acyl-CoA dehydrogenase
VLLASSACFADWRILICVAQGFVNTKDTPSYTAEERPIIDYRVQRYRLFKQLSLAYAIRFIGNWMLSQFADIDSLEDLSSLPEIAATAAGLKGLTTFLASQGMEDLRKCCGGHGYLMASGVSAHLVDYVCHHQRYHAQTQTQTPLLTPLLIV